VECPVGTTRLQILLEAGREDLARRTAEQVLADPVVADLTEHHCTDIDWHLRQRRSIAAPVEMELLQVRRMSSPISPDGLSVNEPGNRRQPASCGFCMIIDARSLTITKLPNLE
jgi:hypothetical protein